MVGLTRLVSLWSRPWWRSLLPGIRSTDSGSCKSQTLWRKHKKKGSRHYWWERMPKGITKTNLRNVSKYNFSVYLSNNNLRIKKDQFLLKTYPLKSPTEYNETYLSKSSRNKMVFTHSQILLVYKIFYWSWNSKYPLLLYRISWPLTIYLEHIFKDGRHESNWQPDSCCCWQRRQAAS